MADAFDAADPPGARVRAVTASTPSTRALPVRTLVMRRMRMR
ncbi:hypothetical protein [Actinomyces oricola]